MKIEPGTVCRIVDAPCLTDKDLIGRECEVVGENGTVIAALAFRFTQHRLYDVRIPLIGTVSMCETCLQPKRPSQYRHLGDWSEISAKTGWNPTRAPA